jgi:hypothetical protein
MTNEFDITLGEITCILAVKLQKLIDYRDNFKYETPHKKPFMFDFTYFGNQDCPHVLNNEALEIIKDKIDKFESVIILLRSNNRNKKGLDKLVESINQVLNNQSAVLFLCNPFDNLQSTFENIYDLDSGTPKVNRVTIDLKPYMADIEKDSPLYLNVMNGYSYSKIAEVLDMPLLTIKNKLYWQKKQLIKQVTNNT